MKTRYELEDIQRGQQWFLNHMNHVLELMKVGKGEWPMSGSDISRPELWKPAAWRWFKREYGLSR